MQHDLAGNMDVDPPFAVAGHGQSEQRGHECRDNRSTERETGIHSPASNKGVGEKKQLIGEKAPDGNTQRPNMPSPLCRGITPQILYRQEARNRETDAN